MTRKEFKETPERKWDEVLHGVRAVWVMPNGKKHDSGWGCFDFVAEFDDDRPNVKFGGCCDAVEFIGNSPIDCVGVFHMDCDYKSRLVHIWSPEPFSVSEDLSTIYFRTERRA